MIISTHGIVASQISQFVGLLDDFPNAAAAYSLRKLSGSYSGSAIRVRRASNNDEQDIGFVNNVLDTAALTTFCSGTNGFIKTWYDQSGNGKNIDTTNASIQPKIVNAGTYLGYVESTSGSPLSSFQFTNNLNFTYFGVYQNFGNGMHFTAVYPAPSNAGAFIGISESGSGSSSRNDTLWTNYTNYDNGVLFGNTRGNMYTATSAFSLITMKSTFVFASNLNYALGDYIYGYNSNRYKEVIIYPNQTVSQSGVENEIISYYGL